MRPHVVLHVAVSIDGRTGGLEPDGPLPAVVDSRARVRQWDAPRVAP